MGPRSDRVMSMTTAQTTKMIARRVRKGYNAQESAALLADLIAKHDGCNLDSALAYNGFTK